jgi:hypothetical protein
MCFRRGLLRLGRRERPGNDGQSRIGVHPDAHAQTTVACQLWIRSKKLKLLSLGVSMIGGAVAQCERILKSLANEMVAMATVGQLYTLW